MNSFSRLKLGSLAVLLALAGCSFSTNSLKPKGADYRGAKSVRSLDIPPDLAVPQADNYYTVPRRGEAVVATVSDSSDETVQEQQLAPAETLRPGAQRMRIGRAGSQRWLVTQGTPEKLWPVLREFWLGLGFALAVDKPAIGVIETDWRENRADLPDTGLRKILRHVVDGAYSSPRRDKFRMRIERGENDTVEIYISHSGMLEVFGDEEKSKTVWQPRPADGELESELLARVMVYLGADEKAARASVSRSAKQAVAAQANITDGGARLRVNNSFDLAWRRVGLALDRINFTVENRNRSQGLYFVRYIDPDKDNKTKKGLFSGLFGKKNKSLDGEQFRLKVDGQDSISVVTVVTKDAKVDSSSGAKKIISLLEQELK